MSDNNGDALEQFRREWQHEVSRRQRRESVGAPHINTNAGADSRAKLPSASSSSKLPLADSQNPREVYQDTLVKGRYDFDDLEAREDAKRLGTSGVGVHPETTKQPTTALEHFERAIEREAQGNMQDSLVHYRKAYKLDDKVDLAYRNKHFPPTKYSAKATHTNPSNASDTVPTTAHHSLHGSGAGALPDLIASFADTQIDAAVPEFEGAPQKPCPIATLPREILTVIMDQIALADVASLMRLATVCRQLAYLVHTEDLVWRTACWHSKFGFSNMKYDFALTIKWQDLPRALDDSLVSGLTQLHLSADSDFSAPIPTHLRLTPNYPTYLENFHSRPRIRFPGVYISTVTYIRPGDSTGNSVYWGNSPVHSVTYYRYLRFYRDGSGISLLTTSEPHDVVPLFHKKYMTDSGHIASKDNVQPPSVIAIMREARRARWRLSPPVDASLPARQSHEIQQGEEPEGNLYVETEGPVQQYTYHLQLALRSVRSKGVAHNTKLTWRSFWSHNHMTNDWSEFSLKHDKAFVYSRVASWMDA